SPIWQWVRSIERRNGRTLDLATPFPTFVVANRSLFASHFDYQKYRAAVIQDQRIPCGLRSALPEKLQPGELTSIILEVTEGFRGDRSAFPAFDVIWVDSFRMPEPVALILPLSTAELSLAADERPDLQVAIEAHGAAARRIAGLRFQSQDENERAAFRKIA